MRQKSKIYRCFFCLLAYFCFGQSHWSLGRFSLYFLLRGLHYLPNLGCSQSSDSAYLQYGNACFCDSADDYYFGDGNFARKTR